MRSRRDQPTEATKAVVPVDAINEQVVIAAVMVDRRAADELLPIYSKDFFYARGHARVWEILQGMHAAGLYYDPATVQQRSGGDVDVKYLEELIRQRPARPPNLQHHLDELAWDHTVITATRGPLASLLDLMKDPVTRTPQRVRALADQLRDSLAGHGSAAYIASGRDVATRQLKVLQDRATKRACYSYGLEDLDLFEVKQVDDEWIREPRMVPGTSPGTITLVTGVSGSGKSTVIAAMVRALALVEKRKVLMGAWEQGDGNTLELMAAMEIGLSRTDLMSGRYSEDDERALYEAMERIGEHVDFFTLPFGRARSNEKQFNDKALDLIQQVVADSGCEVFVADLMRRAFKETDPDDEEQALFRLQAMGGRLKVHQVWAHQQRLKDVEVRSDRRPTREGLKGSSAWVEVPDTILGVHRQALWKNVPDDKVELVVLKQRYGKWPLAVEFDWSSEFAIIGAGRSVEYVQRGEEVNDFDQQVRGAYRGRQ